MKLLSFLGVGKYESTCYIWQGQEHVSCYSLAASSHFLNPRSVTVFLTEEAQSAHAAALRSEIPENIGLDLYPVPKGESELELWDLFTRISRTVAPGEETAFDITNGLRSFPLVGLLAAAFLQTGVGARLRAVLYGAFDIRDRTVQPNRTPMFDLSPMISLLDWSAAADRFNRTGDARYLASLIRAQKKGLALKAAGDPELLDQTGALGSLASGLDGISQALHLIRPETTMELTADLPRRISAARPALNRTAAAQPFEILLEGVQNKFSPLGLADPDHPENLADSLDRQRRIILQYADWELWVQAVTLAREWLINWVMVMLGEEDLVQKEIRGQYEERINSEAKALIPALKNPNLPRPALAVSLPRGEDALRLWDDLITIRNDINHAGMREDPGQAENMIPNIRKMLGRLEQFPLRRSP